MKKFLSVLLALAVAFTFTFGSTMSAFAAPAADATYTQAEAEAAITQAATDAAKAVKTDLATVEKGLNDIPADATNYITAVSKEAQVKVLEEYVNEILTGIETQKSLKLSSLRTAIAAAGDDYVACTTASAEKGYVNFNTTYDVKGFTSAYTLTDAQKLKACEEDLALVKAATIAAIQAIDTTVYSTAVKEGTGKTYQALAIERINNAVAIANLIEVKATDLTTADITGKIAKLQGIYSVGTTEAAGVSGSLVAASEAVTDIVIDSVTYKITSINGLLKVKDEASEATKLEYAKKAAITAVESKVAADKAATIATNQSLIAAEQAKDKPDATKIAGYNEAIEKATKGAAAQNEVMAARINAVKVSSDLVDADFKVLSTWTSTNLVTIDDALTTVANIEKLKAEADLAKASVGIDRTVYAEIDKALEKAIADEYAAVGTGEFKWTTDSDLVAAEQKALIEGKDGIATINKVNYPCVNSWDINDFNKDQYDAFRALVEETKKAINAATTVTAADDAFLAGYAKLDAMVTTAEQTAMFNPGGALYKAYTDYKAQIEAYVDYKLALMDAKENPAVPATLKASLVASLKDGVYSAEQLDKAFADAKTFVDELKTITQLKADKAALEAEVLAIKTPLAVTDKEAVNDLADRVAAHNEYIDQFNDASTWDVNPSLIDSYVGIIKTAEAKAIKDAYDAIMKDGKVTLDEKDKVVALKAAYDEYVKYYSGENASANDIGAVKRSLAVTENEVTGALTAIDNLEIIAVKELVAKLPAAADVTAADKAQIEAARAAYDALSDEAKARYPEPTKLVVAEQVLAEVSVWGTTEVKASLFDSSRKLTIWRTSKTSIRVTSVGSVADIKDHGYTVKYKFYKKAPGSSTYKLVKTTTSNKYTYTNLKKGTNKFQVKVCVYDADGKLVASKWTYYRAAKIK